MKSLWIGFTGQCLTAHGGLAAWSRFSTEVGLREPLRAVLPHAPTHERASAGEGPAGVAKLFRLFSRGAVLAQVVGR